MINSIEFNEKNNNITKNNKPHITITMPGKERSERQWAGSDTKWTDYSLHGVSSSLKSCER